jgi:4-amino-4-deoxy-L-arabinose transferase-like glycosyltransferase
MREKLLTAAGVVVAALLFARLAGAGRAWLPSALVLGGLLLGLVAWQRAVGSGRASRAFVSRHWRALLGRYAFALALAAIVALSLAVRLPSIASDLGHQPIDIDEARLAGNVRHFFIYGEVIHTTVEHYPGLAFWLLSGAALIGYLYSVMHGTIQGIGDMPLDLFVHSGRVANALVGAGTVWMAGLLGRRLSGLTAGLLGAFLVAVVPLAVQTTTSLRNDPAQVLALTGAVYAALRAWQSGHRGWAALSGALAGAATAIKYTSVFAVAPPLVAVLIAGPGPRRAARAAIVMAAFTAAVAVTNHFVWADFPNFIKQLSDQIAITGATHWAASQNPSAFHVEILDRFGPGWPLLLLAAGYGAWTLGRGQPAAWVFWSFPLLYSWFATQRPAQFPRWVYPLVPFVAVAAGAGLGAVAGAIAGWPGWRRVSRGPAIGVGAAGVFALLVLWLPLEAAAVNAGRRLTPPTQVIVERWLAEHAAGQTVLLEDHWLDLRGTTVRANRVPDLPAAIAGGLYALSYNDWVVVPEIHFGNPALKRLQFVHRVSADQRSMTGNLGYDFEIYATPALPTLDRADIGFGTAAAGPYLGPELAPANDATNGVALPQSGASVFLPPMAQASVNLALTVRVDAVTAETVPVAMTVDDQPVPLTTTTTSAGPERTFAALVTPPRPGHPTRLHITPAPGAGPIRLLRLQFE